MSACVERDAGAATLPRSLTALLGAACGLAVANVYLSQPLLALIGGSFGIGSGALGVVVTVTQVGYAAGLLLLVPLGDRVDPRRLIVGQLGLLAAAVAAAGMAPSLSLLLAAACAVGLLAVVVQTIVAFAATLASDRDRGRIVGTVTGGVVIGILLSRALAGAIAAAAGWRAVYAVSAVALVVTAVLCWRLLPPSRTVSTSRLGYRALIVSTFALYRRERLLREHGLLALICFAAFSALWTTLILPLSAPPWSLSEDAVGLLGLAGLAGALSARRAGRLADRGHGRRTTGAALALLTVSWLPIALLEASLWMLVLGIVLLDLAVQAVHVTNQTVLYTHLPDARSRLAGAYMVCYSVGSAAGAIAATALYAAAGWTAVCAFGACLGALGLATWTMHRRAAVARVR